MKNPAAERLNREINSCERCPRLREHCELIARQKRAAFRDEMYWGRPVSNFGATPADLVIVGLAPAAHGANRTGRMFTGDRSGEWLYRALHRAGFANQSSFERADDGLRLINCQITAVAHCAPPGNKPTPEEIENCAPFLERSLELAGPKVILALGAIAWKAVLDHEKRHASGAGRSKAPKFAHGAEHALTGGRTLLASYHPSQQNTFTGVLTEPMFDAVFATARRLIRTRS